MQVVHTSASIRCHDKQLASRVLVTLSEMTKLRKSRDSQMNKFQSRFHHAFWSVAIGKEHALGEEPWLTPIRIALPWSRRKLPEVLKSTDFFSPFRQTRLGYSVRSLLGFSNTYSPNPHFINVLGNFRAISCRYGGHRQPGVQTGKSQTILLDFSQGFSVSHTQHGDADNLANFVQATNPATDPSISRVSSLIMDCTTTGSRHQW